MSKTLTLGELSELVGGTLHGDATIQIRSVAPVRAAGKGDLTWVNDKRFVVELANCQASAALVAPDLDFGNMPVVVCARPDLAIAAALKLLEPPKPHPAEGIDPGAHVADACHFESGVAVGPGAVIQRQVKIGPRSIIHSGVFIGQDTTIGADCVIWPNAVVRERTLIGDRVVIHPNATIGADGFGYNFHDGHFQRIAHIGRVRIEDDVEIGANSCIDRAKAHETVIGRGTKIDNLVQIAHNVLVGEDCCIIAHAGVAGSTQLGNHVVLAGKVGIKDNVVIGRGVQVAACSCVAANVGDGQTVMGIPAEPKETFYKVHSAYRRLPRTTELVRELIKRVEALEAANHQENS